MYRISASARVFKAIRGLAWLTKLLKSAPDILRKPLMINIRLSHIPHIRRSPWAASSDDRWVDFDIKLNLIHIVLQKGSSSTHIWQWDCYMTIESSWSSESVI